MRGLTLDGDDVNEEGDDVVHARLVTMGYLREGASHTGVITRDFLEDFDPTYYDAGMNMLLVGALMPYGNSNTDALKLIGDVALHGRITGGQPPRAERWS